MKKSWLLIPGATLALLLGALGVLWLVAGRQVEGAYFDSEGVQIHYTDQGNGVPVILVHGYCANGDLNWRLPGIVSRLEKNFRVITMDVRGFGLSGKPHDRSKYGLELVNDVKRLMDHLKLEKAHLAGYSMGGFITYKFMALYPERLLSAMPCGAAWMEPGNELCGLAVKIYEGLQGRGEMASWSKSIERFAVDSINDMECLEHVAYTFDQLALTEAEVRAMKTPMMAVRAKQEELVNGGRDFKDFLPGYQVTLIPKGLHSSVIFYRDFADALEQFLLSQPKPAA